MVHDEALKLTVERNHHHLNLLQEVIAENT